VRINSNVVSSEIKYTAAKKT